MKQVLMGGVGNALNAIAMILLLPALVHLSSQNGFYAAQGILFAQIASIFGSYVFSLTIPRTLKKFQSNLKQKLLFELLLFQTTVGILGIFLIVLIYGDFNLPGLCGYIIFYSTVFSWQWFHLTNKTSRIYIVILISSRTFLIAIEIVTLIWVEPSQQSNLVLLPLITATYFITSLPTIFLFRIWEIMDYLKRPKNKIFIIDEFRKGGHLFSASLVTSIYSLGPSLIIFYLSPNLLILFQQFDRIRFSISNFSGTILSAAYPFLLKSSKTYLINAFKSLQTFILIPITLLNFILLLCIPFAMFIPFEIGSVLGKLQISLTSLICAVMAGSLAASSNAIALTFLHPINNDKFYLKTMMMGALIFLISALITGIFFQIESTGIYLMLSIVLAEWFINKIFWLRSKKLIRIFKVNKI